MSEIMKIVDERERQKSKNTKEQRLGGSCSESVRAKEEELCKSNHVVVECRCLQIWHFLSFLKCSSILVLKWQQVLPMLLQL